MIPRQITVAFQTQEIFLKQLNNLLRKLFKKLNCNIIPPIITGNHTEKMDRQFPLTSNFQIKILLKEWLKTSGKTIGEMHVRHSNPEP